MQLSFEVAKPTAGEKDLCPVILLHAIFDSKKSFKVVAPQIANGTGRVVYYVDARNHGASPWDKNFTLTFMADDIKQFLTKQKISKAVLVGTNMGGSVAMKIALEAPELVEKIVVENMVPKPYFPFGWKTALIPITILKEALETVQGGSDFIAAKQGITDYFVKRLPEMNPNQNLEFGLEVMPLKQVCGKFEWEANLDAIEEALLDTKNFNGLYGTYNGEALFLYGRWSNVKVAEDKNIPVMFPQAILVEVEGAAKMVHFELPEEFVKHVVKFINAE